MFGSLNAWLARWLVAWLVGWLVGLLAVSTIKLGSKIVQVGSQNH